MAEIRAFRGLRPRREDAAKVASPPYDVVNTEEARAMAEGNPLSFLHVVRPEIDLPEGTDLYAPEVYAQAASNLQRLVDDGVLVQDETPCLYVYRQTLGGHAQTGLVVAASVEDYRNDVIKKHEHTRPDKEDDRTRHVDTCDANAGPVFLTYRASDEVDAIVAGVTAGEPVYDYEGPGAVQHTFWVVDDATLVGRLETAFAGIPELYVADGHHRSASAARVGEMRSKRFPDAGDDAPFHRFLAVLFPDVQLRIMDYNRVVKDLGGLDKAQLLDGLRSAGMTVDESPADGPYRPTEKHTFGMYLDGAWYRLAVTPTDAELADPVHRLDVSLLQERALGPLLGIRDPRTDARIDFVGGIRGLGELARRVDSGAYAVAFAMHPTTIEDLMAIADAGLVMPPKSTWFEPKLMSGLVVHRLS